MDPSLSPFFHPHGIVIIGASSQPGRLGNSIARNLLASGYTGAMHYVNPRGGVLNQQTVHKNVSEVPDPVDLAIVIVPAPATPAVLKEVAQRGIRAAIISSGGFRESGSQGAALEEECLQIARSHSLRLVGPNCIGLIDYHLPMDTTFINQPAPPTGHLALISQSGAVCGVIMDWARTQGIAFSRMLSLGNQADVSETDMIPGVVEDVNTHVVTFYIESICAGRRFVEAASAASRVKPLVALKVGNSQSGQQAAASHTGALAGSRSAYEAAFRRAGILQAAGIEEMFDWATALAECPPLPGRRIAILTNAGGPGVIASDALESNGLRLATISPATRGALQEFLPQAASLNNPVDILGSATSGHYAACLHLLAQDENVDGVLVILPPPPVDSAEMAVEAMLPVIRSADKPIVFSLMGGETLYKAGEILRAAHVPHYRFAERAVSALGALARRAEILAQPPAYPIDLPGVDLPAAREVVAAAVPGTSLDPLAVERLMAAYGIPTAPIRLAHNAEEAASLAVDLGFPVVLKIASPDIPHKSDLGGVLLDIRSPQDARDGYTLLLERARQKAPHAHLQGVHVQRMVPAGQEVIVGARRDPQFGPLMMFGSGGVEVEGLKDVAFCLAPLAPGEARWLIQNTWAGRKLGGFRSIQPADEAATQDVMQRLSQLAGDLPAISELEINPLRLLAPGQGAIALDVRVKMG